MNFRIRHLVNINTININNISKRALREFFLLAEYPLALLLLGCNGWNTSLYPQITQQGKPRVRHRRTRRFQARRPPKGSGP
jgi:hypothetical protein